MLEGKDLILATRPYAKENRSKSWASLFVTLIALAVAFFGAYFPFPIAVRIASSLLASLLLVRLFMIYHDYLHRAILKKSVWANIIFTIYGLYILAPRSIWKRSHDHHHKHNSKLYTSSIGSFPIVSLQKFRSYSKFERINYLFIRHPLTIAAGYIFAFNWGMCMLSLWRSPSKHWDSALSLLLHYGIGIFVFVQFGLTTFLLGFLMPSVISSAIGSYLFYAQHNFPTATFEDKNGWTYIGAALNSSSYLRMNKIMHWFTGNIGYHHIHHANALIPFYRLPEVYQAFPEFQAAKTTTLHPIDIAKCLQVKVWDPAMGRMLKGSELKHSLVQAH